MTCTPEQIAASLARMRAGASGAYRDMQLACGPLVGQARNRWRMFAEAAADLAGTSVQDECDRAAGKAPEPPWAWTLT